MPRDRDLDDLMKKRDLRMLNVRPWRCDWMRCCAAVHCAASCLGHGAAVALLVCRSLPVLRAAVPVSHCVRARGIPFRPELPRLLVIGQGCSGRTTFAEPQCCTAQIKEDAAERSLSKEERKKKKQRTGKGLSNTHLRPQ